MELLMIFFIVFGLVLTILGAVSVGSINRLIDSLGSSPTADQTKFMRDAKRASVGVLVIGILIMVLAGVFLFTMKNKKPAPRASAGMPMIEMPMAAPVQGMHCGSKNGMKQNVRRYYF